MNLHRTSGKPDWEHVPATQRSRIQTIAAVTYGIVTPPNIVSVVGLGVVIYGLAALVQQQFLLAFCALVIGRLLDLADGWIAEATGTKSPLGELLDATIDKIVTFLTLIVLFVTGVSEWWLLTLLLLPQIPISLFALYKRHRGQPLHPTRIGKLSMAGLWIGVSALLLAAAIDVAWVYIVAQVLTFAAGMLGIIALWQYITGRH